MHNVSGPFFRQGIKSQSPQLSASVQKFHVYEKSEVFSIRNAGAYDFFWIYSCQ